MRSAIITCVLTALIAGSSYAQDFQVTPVEFANLRGWQDEDHAEALSVFQTSCKYARDTKGITGIPWAPVCQIALTDPPPRAFFETLFQPVLITDDSQGRFTGYFEPQLSGSLTKTERFSTPLYSLPDDIPKGAKYFTRAEIMEGALDEKELELVYVDDPAAAYFLQIQGSGRVRLQDGSFLRLGFAGHNGHASKSIGREMVSRELMASHEISAENISAWMKENPILAQEVLATSPSYVFFRKVRSLKSNEGPEGAMAVPLTTARSIAVDPRFIPLGAPVWIDKRGRNPIQRLMIAQDVGSAIKGAQRADIFFGTGKKAGRAAGRSNAYGRLYVLLPNAVPLDVLEGGSEK